MLVLLAARLAGANLDGAVARARGVSRPWGFVVNEVGDRASDLLMFAGLAVFLGRVQGTAGLVFVLVTAVCATLPTVASLAGAGAGGPGSTGVRSARRSGASRSSSWWRRRDCRPCCCPS